MIFVSKYLVPKGYLGLAFYPFVFLKSKVLKEDTVLINHESIHLKQQVELLIVPFYLWYCIEFFIRLLQFKKWQLAYRNISFEREAYANERNLDYLKHRKLWSFLKYLRNNEF
ncbi:hypothetical protein ACFQ1R_03005 [Mariniflexile jejuense]|uniref:Peptidase M56 domain-containing protein n=1 Tax=Mariniflexile jejuense TaxID=1173582 RepID=A0ABW3JG66_9FLAO